MSGILREVFLLFLSGIVIWLAFVLGNTVALLAISILPLGALGEFGTYLGIFLLIVILGFVGRFILKYVPN